MDSVLASIDTHMGGTSHSDTNTQDTTPPVNANGSAPKKTAPPLELNEETTIDADTAYGLDLDGTKTHSDEAIDDLGEEDDSSDLSNDTASIVDTYFDDDEEFLAGDDKVLTEEQDMALFKQSGKVVKWRVENLYRPNGEFRRGNLVRANPPLLIISDSDGNEVEFTVTREFAASMRSVRKLCAGSMSPLRSGKIGWFISCRSTTCKAFLRASRASRTSGSVRVRSSWSSSLTPLGKYAILLHESIAADAASLILPLIHFSRLAVVSTTSPVVCAAMFLLALTIHHHTVKHPP